MGRRKQNGEGSIFQVSENKWVAKISLGQRLDGKPNIKQFSGKTEAIVKKKLREFKTRIEKCSGETLYKLAKVLSVSMETLMESAMAEQATQNSIERSYEYGLPGYLQKDLDAYKEALRNGSTLLDCLWGELPDILESIEKQQFVNPSIFFWTLIFLF